MAIAKMEKLALTFKAQYLEVVLQLMQGGQGVHIETGYESSIPSAKRTEIDKEIRVAEKNLQEIRMAQSVLRGRESTNMLSALKNSQEKEFHINDFTKIVEESNWQEILEEVLQTDRQLQDNRLRRQEVTELLDTLEVWGQLKCNPLVFKKLQRSKAFFGSVHNNHVEEFIEVLMQHEEEGIHFERITDCEERVYFLLICHNDASSNVDVFMNEYSFTEEEYPFDKPQAEVKAELCQEEMQLCQEEKNIDRLIIEQSKYNEILMFAEDYNLNLLLRKKKSLEVTYDGGNIIINGWIVADGRDKFQKLLLENIPEDDYQIIISSVKEKDIDEVPIQLKNGKLVTVYERLTSMYSLPRYDEVDPTPIMTIFYVIFFGMMVADVGYGLAIFLVGLVVKKFLKVKRSTVGFVDFLFYLSFPIMGWGLIYGSFFGLDLPFGLISVTVDIIPMTILSIVIGYIHIMTGLVMQMINQIKLKRYFEMLTGGLAWFMTFLGGGLMILAKATPWFTSTVLFVIGAVVLAVGLGMSILVPAVQYGKRWYAGIGKGLYSLYGATSYLGDFVSYTRLMALGVAGGSVALAFNTILAFLPLPAKLTLGVILAVLLHALNMFLTLLSAYVHGIRLQFIEFFGKFYTGGGKRFEPFKAAEKNVIITDTKKENLV